MSAMPTEGGTARCRRTHAAEIELSSIRTAYCGKFAAACRAVPRGTADPLTNGVAFFVS
jgi:hypothetical protein